MGNGTVDCSNLKMVDPRHGECYARLYGKDMKSDRVVLAPGSHYDTPSVPPPQTKEPPPFTIALYSSPVTTESRSQFSLYPLPSALQLGGFRIGIPIIWNGIVVSTDRLRLDKWASLAGKSSVGNVVLDSGLRAAAEFPSSDLEWWKMISSTRGFERLCLNPGGQYCAGLTLTINF